MRAEKILPDDEWDFIDTVANCVHDVKNSAGVLINSAESIVAYDRECEFREQLCSIQTEARRINDGLMHLLGLYKLEQTSRGVSRDIVDCEDLMLELQACNDNLMAARGLEFELEADDAVEGCFDRELVIGILNTAINNAQRYAKNIVRVSADIEDGYTVFTIADDGCGYSDQVLAAQINDVQISTTAARGGTGLGLFFAQRIAAIHCHRDRTGRVEMSNQGVNGGARFQLWLP